MHGKAFAPAPMPAPARVAACGRIVVFVLALCLTLPLPRALAAGPAFRGSVDRVSGVKVAAQPQAVASLHPAVQAGLMPKNSPASAKIAAEAPAARPVPAASLGHLGKTSSPLGLNRTAAPRFGLPETLTHFANHAPSSTFKAATGQRGKKNRDGSDLIYALGPRDYGRVVTFDENNPSLNPLPSRANENMSSPLATALHMGVRAPSSGLALSPLFACDWKREYGERRPPVNERFASVLTKSPDSFTVTHLDDERESTVVGVSLDGLFRTNAGQPWSFKAAYGMNVRERVGDQTLYGGVEWRF